MVNRRRRIFGWLMSPLIIGIAAGLTLSKCMWGYAFAPPAVRVDPGAEPLSLAHYWLKPELIVQSLKERDSALDNAFKDCRRGHECTYGRTLSVFGSRQWLQTPIPSIREVQAALESAQRLSPVSFFTAGAKGTGVVAAYRTKEGVKVLVAFNSYELHDDTHGYLELLFRNDVGRPVLQDAAHYYYDVAGVEFATPLFLAIFGTVVAYLLTGVAFFVTRALRARKS